MAVTRFVRLGMLLAAVCALGAGLLVLSRGAAASPPSCGAITIADRGTMYRVLFAKNGAVQQYVLLRHTNTEQDHDVLVRLQNKYGPEGVKAPPLRITGFRSGPGGMMIPEKAVDSCGRVIELK